MGGKRQKEGERGRENYRRQRDGQRGGQRDGFVKKAWR